MVEVKKLKIKKLINAATVFFVVLLAIYLAFQLFGGSGRNITTVRTQNITDNYYVTLEGYVVRDEKIVTADDGCVADLLVSNGDRVGRDKAYMEIYPTGLGESELKMVQNELNSLSYRIDMLEDSVLKKYTVSDLDSINNRLESAYSSMLGSISKGDYAAADISRDDMLGALNDHGYVTGRYDVTNDSISSLKAEKQKLLSSVASGTSTILKAQESCYVYTDTDGYENVFDHSNVKDLDYASFSDILSGASVESYDHAVARVISSSEWYFILGISRSQLKYFEEGSTYELLFENDGNKSVKMTACRIAQPSAGSSKGFIVFSSRDIAIGAEISRYTSARVNVGSVSGYRVPEDAVTQIDHDGDGIYDFVGVYVLSGNRAEFRRIQEIGSGAGYVIVKTQERYESDLENKKSEDESGTGTDTEKVTESESYISDEDLFPYLSQNELIILSGGGSLYDGKIFN